MPQSALRERRFSPGIRRREPIGNLTSFLEGDDENVVRERHIAVGGTRAIEDMRQ